MSMHPLILSLDTATSCTTVALTRGYLGQGEVLATLSLKSNVTHSRRLLSTIDWLFDQTQIEFSDLSSIAVGLGPGSFTGLRIGMATAKGLAATADIPLVGISTLDVLAVTCTSAKHICAVLDARKKEVYAAFYRADSEGIARRQADIVVIQPQKLMDGINEPVMMVGDGVSVYGEIWHSQKGVHFAPPFLNAPSAASLGLLAGEKFENSDFLDIASAVPLYVRASDAELSLSTKKKRSQRGGR